METDNKENSEILEENLENIRNLEKEMFESKQDIQKMIEESEEKYKRLFAEFDNYKKRTAKEKELSFTIAKSEMLESLFPVIDALVEASSFETKDEAFKKGIDLVYSQLKTFLDKNNIEEIGVVGEEFNPELHQAIQMTSDSNLESNKIAIVYRKGYKIGDKIIRHAMVIVSQ